GCTLRERHVARHGAKGQAEAIERSRRKAVRSLKRRRPQLLVVVEDQVALLDRAERFIEVPQPLPRRDAFDRDPAKMSPQLLEDLVLERVQGCEIDMAALRRDHLVMIAISQQGGDSKAGPRANDRDDPFVGERMIGPAKMPEMLVAERCNGKTDSSEVVDDGVAVDPQALLHQIGTDHPWIVGELQHLATHRSGKCDRELVGEINPGAAAEFLPGELEARMLGGLQGDRIAERKNISTLDLRQS